LISIVGILGGVLVLGLDGRYEEGHWEGEIVKNTGQGASCSERLLCYGAPDDYDDFMITSFLSSLMMGGYGYCLG
jgi:hypothetical protein